MPAFEDNKNTLPHFVAGGVGGVFSVVAGHPLDTIKVRLQTMHQAKALGQRSFKGVSDCALQTIRYEGVRGLFKGLIPPIMSGVPSNACFFMGSAVGRSFFHKKDDTDADLSNLELFISGCFGGLTLAALNTPFERVKCILQTRQNSTGHQSQLHGVVNCVQMIYRREGLTGFYRGLGITLVRDVAPSGMFILTYANVLNTLNGHIGEDCSRVRRAGGIMLAGGLAGMVDWVLSIAQDTIKSRVQTAPEGMYPRGARDAFKHLMATEGTRGLFHGLSAVLLRAFVSNAFCLLGYEVTVSVLTRHSV